MPSSRTDLSAGNLNGSDRLTVELVEATGEPPIIAITWPPKPTVCTPAQFDQVVATAMRLLSAAVIELAALRVRKRLYGCETLPGSYLPVGIGAVGRWQGNPIY
jgi:hypothetical protein